jgi:hypothetical protein
VTADIEELADLSSSSLHKDFERGVLLNVPKPGDVGRYSDSQLEAIAAQE